MTDTKPLRWAVRLAAEKLGVSTQTVIKMAKANLFTVLRGGPAGHGRRMYLRPAEVEAFAAGGLEALAEAKAAAKP